MKIQGTEVAINTKLVDFRKYGYNFEGSESLIYYVPDEDCVLADVRADKSYVKYAAVHEAICQGKYKHLAPECESPNCQCLEIDKMIVGLVPEEEKKNYIKNRIIMFGALIDNNMNPKLNDMFKESLDGLKKL